MAELAAQIIRISETFRIDESGATLRVRVVMWKLGQHGPFSFESPAEGFSAADARGRVEREASELRAALPPEPA